MGGVSKTSVKTGKVAVPERGREDFARAVRNVYRKEIIPLAEKGLCASVFTQAADVEDETNGVLTYDRKVCKLKPEEMEGIAEALQRAVAGTGN